MKTTLRDNLYTSTISKCWVCLIENRFLKGKGYRSYNKCAWSRKCDVAQVFKHSDYWRFIVRDLKRQYPEIDEMDWIGAGCGRAKYIMKEKYDQLRKDGVVRYLEVGVTPFWVE